MSDDRTTDPLMDALDKVDADPALQAQLEAAWKERMSKPKTTAESQCAGALARSGRRPPEVCPRCGATDNDFCGHLATQERQIAEMAMPADQSMTTSDEARGTPFGEPIEAESRVTGIPQTTRARAALENEAVTITRAEYYDMQQEIDDLKAENARLREVLRECHGWVPGDDEATAASILFKKALPNLVQVRDWAQDKTQGGEEPPWAWYQYMKLIEAVDAILAGMAVTTTEGLPRSEQATHLRLAACNGSQDTSRYRPDQPPFGPLPT